MIIINFQNGRKSKFFERNRRRTNIIEENSEERSDEDYENFQNEVNIHETIIWNMDNEDVEKEWRGAPLINVEMEVNGVPITALLDPGATNNYIDEKFIKENQPPQVRYFKKKLPFKIHTGKGMIESLKIAKFGSVKMETFEDTASFIILPEMKRHQAILGMTFFIRNNPQVNWTEPSMTILRHNVKHFILMRFKGTIRIQ